MNKNIDFSQRIHRVKFFHSLLVYWWYDTEKENKNYVFTAVF